MTRPGPFLGDWSTFLRDYSGRASWTMKCACLSPEFVSLKMHRLALKTGDKGLIAEGKASFAMVAGFGN
jgi:hypothetical protein